MDFPKIVLLNTVAYLENDKNKNNNTIGIN